MSRRYSLLFCSLALSACTASSDGLAPPPGGASATPTLLPAPPPPPATGSDDRLILLDGYPINTAWPELTYGQLPAHLRRQLMAKTMAGVAAGAPGLYLVQLAGPIEDSWRRALTDVGAEIVGYIPYNAYVVRADGAAAAALARLRTTTPFVRFVGDYEPGFRISPALRAVGALRGSVAVDVTVQIVDGPGAAAALAALGARAQGPVQVRRVLGYLDVALTVDAARVGEIAGLDDVFAIEERTGRVRLDEAQGQIVAGNLTGASPTGPGYVSWLQGKGFDAAQFGSFAVNVVDDALSLVGHPDLPIARVAFASNPTAQLGPEGGHGFLNSHIIGGFNADTGSAFEDSRGFNYGLGISPFARVGTTAIFGPGVASPTTWEDGAYTQGARISSNSWGFTGLGARRYDANAQEIDRVVRDAQTGAAGLQQLIVVFAAGNDGPGANTVSTPGTAKNIISVGASENDRQTGLDGCAVANSGANSVNDIINFSSRGPVNSGGGDGRVKPDLVAPGTHIEAGVPQTPDYDGSSVCDKFFPAGQTLYGWSSGTSHACPAVAGGASLLYQDFLNKGRPAPSPAMVKAFLMNSAAYMTGVGANDTLPSNNQGMGRLDLGRALDGTSRILVDQTTVLDASGQTFQISAHTVDPTQPLRVTLAWTDAPGAITGAPWVNNLDLEVSFNGPIAKGNVFSGRNSAGGGSADARNNVESVFIPAGSANNFTVTVKATNIAGDGIPGNGDPTDQDFALVIYNAAVNAPPAPTIGASPSSFTFTATAGGANPANQTLTISNTGGGTLSFTASDDAPWLSLGATSGTAPASTSVSVDTGGLAAGTYNAAITISAPGATNTPVAVPVTLTVSPMGPPPTIGVSPASLTFSATAGGSNPPSQVVNVSNTGGGTLSFTASDDAAWLSVTPAAGTAPAATTASVNIAGLAAGTYNGTITIGGAGATNTPVNVPVTLTVAAAPDLIVNGGFEGNTAAPWDVSGSAGYANTGAGTGSFPHAGEGYVFLGDVNSAAGQVFQTITIPSNAQSATLTFWLSVTSQETTTTLQNDRLFLEARNPTTGALLGTLATYSNLNKGAAGVYAQKTFNLLPGKGQTIRLQFRATTDGALPTTFLVDDVSVR